MPTLISRRGLAAAGITAALTFTLGACGSDDESLSTADREKTSDFATDAPTSAPTDTPTGAAPTAVAPDDDRGLLGKTKAKAEAAALKATGEGRVTRTSGSGDADHVYEVDVLLPNGQGVTVELDASFVVTKIDR